MERNPQFARWDRALSQMAKGDARFLLELLLVPTTTDGHGNPLSFEQLPDDLELRHRIVRALLARPEWAAGNLAKLWTHVGRGAKPVLSAYEISAASVYLSDLTGDERADAIESLAAAYGIKPETLRKKLAQRRVHG